VEVVAGTLTQHTITDLSVQLQNHNCPSNYQWFSASRVVQGVSWRDMPGWSTWM